MLDESSRVYLGTARGSRQGRKEVSRQGRSRSRERKQATTAEGDQWQKEPGTGEELGYITEGR